MALLLVSAKVLLPDERLGAAGLSTCVRPVVLVRVEMICRASMSALAYLSRQLHCSRFKLYRRVNVLGQCGQGYLPSFFRREWADAVWALDPTLLNGCAGDVVVDDVEAAVSSAESCRSRKNSV